jgi:putative methionine-R-sulfoxide reductase with GAF domain
MPRSAQPDDPDDARDDDRVSSLGGLDTSGLDSSSDFSRGSSTLDETELDSALQLLVERAQYITGATGAALALPQGEEMVCRASAGSSAPVVGARLQVRSGLTSESIARRQLLRCNNAESDPRVNLEACRALGIASIVVLPLLHPTGKVRGLFELFSDHPYAFEERDLIALERMADLTLTALDLAERPLDPSPGPRREPAEAAEPASGFLPEDGAELSAASAAAIAEFNHQPDGNRSGEPSWEPGTTAVSLPPDVADEPTPELAEIPSSPVSGPAAAVVPEAMLRVQKCASCGFPVSEGRTLCLDCEKKDAEKTSDEQKLWVPDTPSESASVSSLSSSSVQARDEFVPAFLVNAGSRQGSWVSNHVNLLAIVVLILGILVAVVVFR